MSTITFSRDKKQEIAEKLRGYIAKEFELEIGEFDSEFMLDFIAEEIGPHFYNQGLADAISVVQERVEGIVETITWLEKPTNE